jgi:hypothetical protein
MTVWRLHLPILLTLTIAPFATAQPKPQQSSVSVRDGGLRGRMESIFIPPKTSAPFSFVLITEWSRPLENGGTYTLTNERRIMRDSSGRIYQERWYLVPKGGKIPSRMDVFQITDPEQHVWLNCAPATKICELLPYRLTVQTEFHPPVDKSGPLPDGSGFRREEDLGVNSIQGEETHGYRETTTINVGVMGNDRPIIAGREFWFAERRGLNLISVVDSPNSGKQTFTVKELTTSEPDGGFFKVPGDYKIVDRMNSPN